MSNYNTTLQSNNNDLQTILNTINELSPPEDTSIILQDKTVTPTTSEQAITADDGYDGLDTVIVNPMPITVEKAVPTISIDNNGLITATVTQASGYAMGGIRAATQQLSTQSAQTIIPDTSDKTIASGTYLTGIQTIKGDSNLIAENIKSGISIFGVNGSYECVDESINYEDELISRTIVNYIDNGEVTTIGNTAFYYCSRLTSVSFPVATTIGNRAFTNCYNLTSVSFPKVTSIGLTAFDHCFNLTSVNFPEVISIGNTAFSNCYNLTSVDFPKVLTIGNTAFQSCYNLTSINFPVCTTIGNYAFEYCFCLTSVDFPKVTSIGSYAFEYCSSLTSVNFPEVTIISSRVFTDCYKLSSLTLGASTVCTLSNSNAFASTPYAGYSSYFSGTPIIYVPSSLLTSYQNATNWTYFSSYFIGY